MGGIMIDAIHTFLFSILPIPPLQISNFRFKISD